MKRRTGLIRATVMILLVAFCLTGCAQKPAEQPLLDPNHPITISVWNYYNGAQLEAFNQMVDLFNETRGKELGVIVTGYSQGSVNDLQVNVLNSINGKVGADEVPNIFAAYADTAYEIDQMGKLVDLSTYLSEEQRAKYVTGYLSEGDFDGKGSMKIFPIAKSTELFLLNDTDWQKFTEATGAKYEDFSTMEGLVQTAQRYYEWTDSLTETPDDGKAFYGRDAMANYFLIGGMQLGCEIFESKDGTTTIHFDKAIIKKLWDHYYIPFVKGYFAASGRFRSDDIKIGNIIAFTGSSSGATFFPKKVAADESEYDITMKVFNTPRFSGGQSYAVQQGAGMVVTKKSEAEIRASIEFLLWFTQPERNISFSVNSGYMPVTWEANTMEAIRDKAGDIDVTMDAVLTVAVDTVQSNTLYTTKAFKNGAAARNILEYRMSERAIADRALVRESIQNGMSMEEAVAEYVADEYFEHWYEMVLTELNGLSD